MENFNEAMFDPSTNLTYPALKGQRKQSVRDVETLFSDKVEQFMEDKGYTSEAKYIKAVRHWRLACHMRGLSQLERCRYNYELLNLILSDLMPWYETNYDFSTLEVARSLRTLHSGKNVIEHEHQDWIKKGHFSVKSIQKYCAANAESNIDKNELIPAKQLVHLLKHVRLIAALL